MPLTTEGVFHPPLRVVERVMTNASRGSNGCLISNYSITSSGYAQIGWREDGRRVSSYCHRVSLAGREGPFPAAMTVDHVCKTKLCVDPDHLRLLTNFENARRTGSRDWPLGQCANGHSNEILRKLPSGKLVCDPCARAFRRAYAERQRRAAA